MNGNLRAAPAWLTGKTADDLIEIMDCVGEPHSLADLGLSAADILKIVRIARWHKVTPNVLAGTLIRCALDALEVAQG